MAPRAVSLALAIASLAIAGCSGTVAPAPAPGTVTVLATLPWTDYPGQLAVGSDFVYWLDNTEPEASVRALPKAGGPSSVLVDGLTEAFALAYGDGRVFYTSDGIYGVSAAGGVPVWRGPGSAIAGGLAVDGHELWGALSSGTPTIVTASTATGSPEIVYAASQSEATPMAFALGPTHVVWSVRGAQATLWALPRAGGTPAAIATSPYGFGDVAVSATHAFWAVDGTIEAVPLAGGSAFSIPSSGSVSVQAIDGAYLYWSDGQRLQRTPTEGGATEVVADDQQGLASIAFDESRVYWLAGGWEIRATDK